MSSSRFDNLNNSGRSSLSQGSSRRVRNRSGRSGSGYSLRSHNIRFGASTGTLRDKLLRLDRRTVLVLAIALVVIIVAVLGISGIVRSCTAPKAEDVAVNELDSRVAVGASAEVTSALTPRLDLNEYYQRLADQADRYEDATLINLAIYEPSALELVLAYPDLTDPENAEAQLSQPYTGNVTIGLAVPLYCWDIRWGAVEYNGGPIALTGSGPCAVASAAMMVTGKTDKNPADVAALVIETQNVGGDTGMQSSFISNHGSELGISTQFYEPGIDNLRALLAQGYPVLADAKAGVLSDQAHWIVVTALNADGSVSIFDPTSSANSSHSWSIGTIGTGVGTLYSVAAAPTSE